MTASEPLIDSGLATERTVLAWTRTSLCVLANGGLLLWRCVQDNGSTMQIVVATVGLLAGAITYGLRMLRERVLARDPWTDGPMSRRFSALVGVLVLSVVAAWMASTALGTGSSTWR